jgi:hypothetical protein
VDRSRQLFIPTLYPSYQGDPKNQSRKSESCPHPSNLAIIDVVAPSSTTHSTNDRPSSDTKVSTPAESSPNSSSLTKSQAQSNFLFGDIGPLVSETAQQIIKQALAKSTAQSYVNALGPFKDYCTEIQVPFAQITDVNFINFA